jgi:NADH dehydrogenase/NADH:ubiquinone oxidoreductase subunit G
LCPVGALTGKTYQFAKEKSSVEKAVAKKQKAENAKKVAELISSQQYPQLNEF